MNSLSSGAIREALRFFEARPNPMPRAIILTGAGKAFISGADIHEMIAMDSREASAFSELGNRLMDAIESYPVPVIAAVNGYAFGGGFEVALAADFIVASAGAKMGLPEVTLGLIPGFGGVGRLCSRIGAAKAKELLFTGALVAAQEALELGIVNRVFPPEELMFGAMRLASLIGAAGPRAIRAAKRRAASWFRGRGDAGGSEEAAGFGELFAHDEPCEGLNAFIGKRKPLWAERGQA
jgi:enoyl-CoA hydratase